MRAALFMHVVQRCISAGLVGHACEDSDQESRGSNVMSEMPKASPLGCAHGPHTETVYSLEGPADRAPDHSCWAKSRMWRAAPAGPNAYEGLSSNKGHAREPRVPKRRGLSTPHLNQFACRRD